MFKIPQYVYMLLNYSPFLGSGSQIWQEQCFIGEITEIKLACVTFPV